MSEHQLNEFRAKLRKRNRYLTAALVTVMVLFLCLAVAQWERLSAMPEFLLGFYTGALCGAAGMLLFLLINNLWALRDPARCKKLYIAETDERNVLIQRMTGTVSFSITVFGLLLSIVVSGFFDETVFYTLLATLFFFSLVRLALKVYYRVKL